MQIFGVNVKLALSCKRREVIILKCLFYNEPRFYDLFYNSLDEQQRKSIRKNIAEVVRQIRKREEKEEETCDTILISVNDGIVNLLYRDEVYVVFDLREEVSDKVLVPKMLLEKVLHDFTIMNGLYATDLEENVNSSDFFVLELENRMNMIEDYLEKNEG